MAEIPEHLRKRAEEARQKAEAKKAADAKGPVTASTEASTDGGGESRIPGHLLERSQAAKAQASGSGTGGSGSLAVTERTESPLAVPGAPIPTGPGGHTQRLLTVVKSGSIQDVKATPQDKVHVWPHLLAIEFVAALAVTVFLLVFSIFVNAPLQELANTNNTPNPAKAPWYFLGLQELLKMFHPMVAGVTIPGIGLFALILAPYSDRNPSNKPKDRKFVISLFTVQLMFWAILVMLGTFFRGPGFNFIWPWETGLFVEL